MGCCPSQKSVQIIDSTKQPGERPQTTPSNHASPIHEEPTSHTSGTGEEKDEIKERITRKVKRMRIFSNIKGKDSETDKRIEILKNLGTLLSLQKEAHHWGESEHDAVYKEKLKALKSEMEERIDHSEEEKLSLQDLLKELEAKHRELLAGVYGPMDDIEEPVFFDRGADDDDPVRRELYEEYRSLVEDVKAKKIGEEELADKLLPILRGYLHHGVKSYTVAYSGEELERLERYDAMFKTLQEAIVCELTTTKEGDDDDDSEDEGDDRLSCHLHTHETLVAVSIKYRRPETSHEVPIPHMSTVAPKELAKKKKVPTATLR